MKKKVFGVVLLLLVSTGCNDYIKDYNDSVIETQTSQVESGEAIKPSAYDKYARFDFGNDMFSTDGNGLFYASTHPEKAYYYSYSTNKSIEWCNKPECNHDSKECTASIAANESRPGVIFFKCYDNKIYKLIDENYGMVLYQFNVDGSNQTRIGNLYPDELTGFKLCVTRFYGDSYYYSGVDDNNNVHYYSLKLSKDSSPEELFVDKNDDTVTAGFGFYVNDDGLYFGRTYKDNVEKYMFYQYNFDTKEIKKVFEFTGKVQIVLTDTIYFLSEEDGIYKINNNNQAELVWRDENFKINSELCNIYANSKCIVLEYNLGEKHFVKEDKYFVYIYDIEKQIMNKVNLPYDLLIDSNRKINILLPIGIDGTYMYMMQTGVAGCGYEYQMLLIDLTTVTNEKMDYRVIYL